MGSRVGAKDGVDALCFFTRCVKWVWYIFTSSCLVFVDLWLSISLAVLLMFGMVVSK